MGVRRTEINAFLPFINSFPAFMKENLTKYQSESCQFLADERTLFLCPFIHLVVGSGFEPLKAEPADLQSAPIGRSGNPPLVREVQG